MASGATGSSIPAGLPSGRFARAGPPRPLRVVVSASSRRNNSRRSRRRSRRPQAARSPRARYRLVGHVPRVPIYRAAYPTNANDALQSMGLGPLGRIRGLASAVGLLRSPVRPPDVPDLHGNWLDGCWPAPPPPPWHRGFVLGNSADTGYFPGAGDTAFAGNRTLARLGVGVVPLGARVSRTGFNRGVSALRPHWWSLEPANRRRTRAAR